jgi:hypothetical protein
MESIKGRFGNKEFKIWKDSEIELYFWTWGIYGGQVASLARCWESIRCAACVWEKDGAGNWRHSSEAITS